MRLNIIDPNTLDLIGVLTQYESVQWSPTFNTPDGTFQINCSTDYVEILQNDYLIENTEELDHIGVIKRVQTLSTNQKTSLQVDGVMLEKDIFYRRVVKAWIVWQGLYPTHILNNLIGLALTDTSEPERKLPIIGTVVIPKVEDVPDMTTVEYSANYPNLGDEVFNLIQNLNLGVRARINRDTMKVDVEFYTGNDYTFGSDDAIVFSPERGTVLEANYVKDSSQNITNLTVLGEGNLRLEAEREKEPNEPLIEKSIDISNECPWPTYHVEKPNEEGGQYYRYKKYNPPADFITNRDVWEKYAVDRIETEETRYREKESTEFIPLSLEELMDKGLLYESMSLKPKDGAVLGSLIPVGTSVQNIFRDAKPNEKKTIGIAGVPPLPEAATLSVEEKEDAVVTEDPNAVKPPSSQVKLLKASSNKKKKKVTKSGLKSSITSKNGLSSAKQGGVSSNLTQNKVSKIDAILEESNFGGMVIKELTETPIEMEEYKVEIVTYETKDFLEYVYVSPGTAPSEASKIVQGSFASGDAIYYENFVDVKVEEQKYRDALMNKATEYLKTFVISETVTVKPYYLSNMVYNKNYKIGDLVTARNSRLGYAVDLRVTQATETWDSTGYGIEIVLGDSIPTLTNRIKLIAKGGA